MTMSVLSGTVRSSDAASVVSFCVGMIYIDQGIILYGNLHSCCALLKRDGTLTCGHA